MIIFQMRLLFSKLAQWNLFNNHISLFMMLKIVAVLILVLSKGILASYNPQLMLTVTPDLINRQISTNLGQYISQGINTADIKLKPFEQKISGVNVKFNLTQIKQQVDIQYKTNALKVKDKHNFVINSKNVNVTLNGTLQLKIGLLKKQKGPLKVVISHLQVDTSLRIEQNTCPKGIGFNVRIMDLFIDLQTKDVSIKIEGKSFDNRIIAELQKYIIPKLPNLINTMAQEKANPVIQSYTCQPIQQEITLKDQNYILTVNTSQIPEFYENLEYFRVPIDLTFQNIKTNETNDDVEKDSLPANNMYQKSSDGTLSLSSNMLNSIIWLLDDSDYLQFTVTNEMLGTDPPILLNTTNLSILMPDLKRKWPNREVYLMIEPSTKFEHLLIRSGRLVSIISLSVKFVVNIAGKTNDATECLLKNECVVACNLNITLPLSLSLSITTLKLYRALIHTASFYDISIIDTPLIDLNLQSLKDIINSIVGSMLPSINSDLQSGQTLPQPLIDLMAKFGAIDIKSRIFQDFISAGVKFNV